MPAPGRSRLLQPQREPRFAAEFKSDPFGTLGLCLCRSPRLLLGLVKLVAEAIRVLQSAVARRELKLDAARPGVHRSVALGNGGSSNHQVR